MTGDAVAVASNAPGRSRWWWAVAAGALAAVPLGWLLSYAATLMMLLGLFFFVLFGLVIGAVMYRYGSPARPIPSRRIKLGVALVVLIGWGISYGVEVRDFPIDKANDAIRVVSPLPEGMTREEFKADVERFVRDTLAERYGGSGPIGYARWVLAEKQIEYPVETMLKPIVLTATQGRWLWSTRVTLSIVLLAFGIYSQVSPLRKVSEDSNAEEPAVPV